MTGRGFAEKNTPRIEKKSQHGEDQAPCLTFVKIEFLTFLETHRNLENLRKVVFGGMRMGEMKGILDALRAATEEERAEFRSLLFSHSGEPLSVVQEHDRIKALFDDVDEKQVELADGAIWEAARIRHQLDEINERVKVCGLIKFHPDDPTRQKALPVSRELPKLRAGYANIIFKLIHVFGANVDEDEFGLEDYE